MPAVHSLVRDPEGPASDVDGAQPAGRAGAPGVATSLEPPSALLLRRAAARSSRSRCLAGAALRC